MPKSTSTGSELVLVILKSWDPCEPTSTSPNSTRIGSKATAPFVGLGANTLKKSRAIEIDRILTTIFVPIF
jgi:hypothetical protein